LKYNYEISRQLERELDKLRRRNKKQFEIISIKPLRGKIEVWFFSHYVSNFSSKINKCVYTFLYVNKNSIKR